jgi:hypothetical protein
VPPPPLLLVDVPPPPPLLLVDVSPPVPLVVVEELLVVPLVEESPSEPQLEVVRRTPTPRSGSRQKLSVGCSDEKRRAIRTDYRTTVG